MGIWSDKQFEANLLLITFDQFRGDWGNPHKPIIELPGIASVAMEGTTSSSCYTSCPQCVPARMSWITGLEPSRLGLTQNQPALITKQSPSIIRQLNREGWTTNLIGKSHWTNHNKVCDLKDTESLIMGLGFDNVTEVAGPRALQVVKCELTREWEEYGLLDLYKKDLSERYRGGMNQKAWEVRPTVLPTRLYPDIWIADRAKNRINQLSDEKPWLLWISFVGPHEPFDTPNPWNGYEYSNFAVKERGKWIEELNNKSELKIKANQWGMKLNDANLVQELRVDYANHLRLLDEQVTSILKKLEKRNDWDKTAICITSDHGEMLGDAGMLYKSTFLESSILVPMIYKSPPRVREKRGVEHKKPCNSTNELKKIIKGLRNGGKIKKQKENSREKPYAIVEYGKEIGLIQTQKKICIRVEDDSIQWAIDMARDPDEQYNVYKDNGSDWENSKEWKVIIENAKKETKKRRSGKWQKYDFRI